MMPVKQTSRTPSVILAVSNKEGHDKHGCALIFAGTPFSSILKRLIMCSEGLAAFSDHNETGPRQKQPVALLGSSLSKVRIKDMLPVCHAQAGQLTNTG
jgi:hypothetical protein